MAVDNIIGTGLSGLVGSRIVELLSPKISFEDISRKTGTDITNTQAVLDRISNSKSPVILHLAGKTDVDGAEREKELGKESEAWKINVEGTRNVVSAAKNTRKKLIYVSTDMVFSGDQTEGSKYSEEDTPAPANFYAQTKFEGEKIVRESGISYIILRIAYPYRGSFEKKEYVRIFKSLLEQGKEIKAVADHFFTPTFIDDLAPVLLSLLEKNAEGIFHAVGDEIVSPFMVAQKIAEVFGYSPSLISSTTRAEFFKDRAIRGFNLSLQNDKIKKLGVTLHSLSEGLQIIKTQ